MTTTPKEIIFDEEARENIACGIYQLADVVAFTLGPNGRNVGMETGFGAPSITNDGNRISRDIELENPSENIGISIGKEVVEKINEKCGDGTTTGLLLLRALVKEGLKHIAAGASPMPMKLGIEKAVTAVVNEIKQKAKQISSHKEIQNISTVSASGNQEIGQYIADAFEKVGLDGVITIEEAKGTDSTIEIVEGMQFDRGYLSPYFCTNTDKMVVEMENPQILLIDKKVSNIHDLLPALQTSLSSAKPLLIIAEDIEGEPLSTLVVNKLRGGLQIAAVKAPGFGDKRKAMLEDIAVLTGATVISEEAGHDLQKIEASWFGECSRLKITKESSTIVGGKGQAKALKARLKQIDCEIDTSSSSYDKEKLEERKAKLKGGVAVIHVGAATEPELKERKQKVEDSLSATKAALEQGVAIGGGLAFFRACSALKNLTLPEDEAVGVSVVRHALSTPLKQIAINAGLDGSVTAAEIEKAEPSVGLNAHSRKLEDLEKSKIFDPVKVLITALQHAASAAALILITNAIILDAPEENED